MAAVVVDKHVFHATNFQGQKLYVFLKWELVHASSLLLLDYDSAASILHTESESEGVK